VRAHNRHAREQKRWCFRFGSNALPHLPQFRLRMVRRLT